MPKPAGHHNEGRGNAKTGGDRRGSVNNAKRLDAFQGRGAKGSADWGSCDAQLLLGVIVAITALGGAATIGLSRDQGAYSLTLLLDDARQTLWYNGDADLDDELRGVLAIIESL